MPFVQGEFREDFRFIQYGNTAEPAMESVLDLGFPPVQSAPAGITDLTFPGFDEGVVVQPHESAKGVKGTKDVKGAKVAKDAKDAGESKRAGALSHIRGWFSKE